MRTEDIIKFVKKNIQPLPAYPPYGERYRVSATMTDGTILPCVVIESATRRVDLALKRFDETRKSSDPHMGHRVIVTLFVTKNNSVNDYSLRELANSSFAIPPPRMKEIKGETSMGWTEFYAVMKDGAEFRFGTTFTTEFFDMPSGYSTSDIAKIIPAIRGETPRQEHIYREKPFFICYVEGL
jgi:hypothetical protein